MRSYTIALATFGSQGDLHPFLAIARELKQRGHHPVIATIGLYKDNVEAAGFEFRQLRFALDDRPLAELMRKVMNGRDGLKFLVRDLMMPALPSPTQMPCLHSWVSIWLSSIPWRTLRG